MDAAHDRRSGSGRLRPAWPPFFLCHRLIRPCLFNVIMIAENACPRNRRKQATRRRRARATARCRAHSPPLGFARRRFPGGAAVNQMAELVGLIFGMQRWSLAVAAAWVMTRQREFLAACVRPGAAPTLQSIETDADDWRRNIKIEGRDLGRQPVKFFPTSKSAYQQLRAELPHDKWDFSKDEVLSKFPKLDDPDQARVIASVWRGSDPRKIPRISLSHAAWWIVSKGGTAPFALDDYQKWTSAFVGLLSHIADGRLVAFDQGRSPAQQIPASNFDTMRVKYPCGASGWSALEPGHHDGFIECDSHLEGIPGDRLFLPGKREPAWRNIVVNSTELVALYTTAGNATSIMTTAIKPIAMSGQPATITKRKKKCSLKQYKQHWKETEVRPSRKEDRVWAKAQGYNVESVFERRKEFKAKLPTKQRELIKSGPRKF
jgi:hypothetical protein